MSCWELVFLSLKEEPPNILTCSVYFKKRPGNKRSETSTGNTRVHTVSPLIWHAGVIPVWQKMTVRGALLTELSSGMGIDSCSLGRTKITSNSLHVLSLQNGTARLFRLKEVEWQQVLAPLRSASQTRRGTRTSLRDRGTCSPEVPLWALIPVMYLCRDVLETQAAVTTSVTSLGWRLQP